MLNLNIKINQSDFKRMISALNREDSLVRLEENDLPYRCAVGFRDLVFRKILSGELSHPPYNPDYAKFKRRYGDKGPWRLHDNLLQSLSVFKSENGGGWYGGIPDGPPVVRVSMRAGGKNKKIKIAKYARTLEYGTGVQKKRPVFVPATQEYRKDGFVDEVNKTTWKIRNAWK